MTTAWRKKITTRNPQANAVKEKVHRTLGNIIHTFELQKIEVDEDDPWTGILSATMFAIRVTVHTTLQYTPMQSVFGRDAILNVQHEANWKFTTAQRQKFIYKNNKIENAKCIPHTYNIGDKVMIKNDQTAKYSNYAYKGSYTIIEKYNNGTIRIQMGPISDT